MTRQLEQHMRHPSSTANEVPFLPDNPKLAEQLARIISTVGEINAEITSAMGGRHSDQALKDPAEKPLDHHLTYLAARFLVQEYQTREYYQEQASTKPLTTKEKAKLWKPAAGKVVENLGGVSRAKQRLDEHDIPAYRVVYDLFDQLRLETPGGITEAYMGRDGLFAYYGRLGQLAGRGDNEPLLKLYPADRHDTPPARARYIVYSSGLKGSSYEDLHAYLTQFVHPDDVVHFFDTGYQGSAPQHALTILGVAKKYHDDRIHLLEHHNMLHARQIPGLPTGVSVEEIESHYKDDNGGYGLKKEGGVVRYMTTATSAEEQFWAGVRRHFLYRHFMLTERQKINTITI